MLKVIVQQLFVGVKYCMIIICTAYCLKYVIRYAVEGLLTYKKNKQNEIRAKSKAIQDMIKETVDFFLSEINNKE